MHTWATIRSTELIQRDCGRVEEEVGSSGLPADWWQSTIFLCPATAGIRVLVLFLSWGMAAGAAAVGVVVALAAVAIQFSRGRIWEFPKAFQFCSARRSG